MPHEESKCSRRWELLSYFAYSSLTGSDSCRCTSFNMTACDECICSAALPEVAKPRPITMDYQHSFPMLGCREHSAETVRLIGMDHNIMLTAC